MAKRKLQGTLLEITGQESGFWIYPDSPFGERVFLDNWSANFEEYECQQIKRIKNCLKFIEPYCRRDDEGEIRFVENAYPVTEEDIAVEGTVYYFDGFIIVAPNDWN